MTKVFVSPYLPPALPHAFRQVLWNPVFGCMFFGYMGAVDGMGPSAISEKIKNNLWTSVGWVGLPIVTKNHVSSSAGQCTTVARERLLLIDNYPRHIIL